MWKKYNYAIGVMSTSYLKKQFEHFFQPGLEKIPAISFYARTRGWPFVIAWGHRIAGVLLTLYVLLHIYTLSFLVTPGSYDAEMKVYGFFLFSFLEWLLALPVIFHALNGGRLISFELFGTRSDRLILMWVFGLTVIYVLLQAVLMILGTQSVTPVFFWLTVSILSLCLVVLVTTKIWQTKGSVSWKLQRISGAYLFIMIPAHLLFMHLQPAVGHEASVVIARMQHIFIKLVDITLVIAVLFHAGYGLVSIGKDYITSRILQKFLTFLVILVISVFGWIGVKIILIV
jgi:succinate dehydrogenase / fumarate reductase cytochrome b subunit